MKCAGSWISTQVTGGENRTNCQDDWERVPRFRNIGCDFKFQKVQKNGKKRGGGSVAGEKTSPAQLEGECCLDDRPGPGLR